MPGDTKAARKKAATEIEGRSLVLSKTQRIHLWEEDKAFALFTWLWPGQQRDVDLFIMKICELAKQDGFHIEFTDLVGSDHIQMLEQGKRNWGTGSMFSSDVRRPVSFPLGGKEHPASVAGEVWADWRQTMPTARVPDHDVPQCAPWPCWAC
jgi:hypothetical protein